MREARAVLDEAKLTNDRAQTFVKEGIGTKADQDRAYAALKVAESRYQDALEEVSNRQALLLQRRSELELAEQAVRDSNLTAPLDGMVRERHATVGQYLAAGTPVVTVVRMHPLRLRLRGAGTRRAVGSPEAGRAGRRSRATRRCTAAASRASARRSTRAAAR